MSSSTGAAANQINSSNRFGIDYAASAQSFAPTAPFGGIIDVHTHINGLQAARLYRRAAQLYGVTLTYSMTQLEQVPALREIFGSSIRFIAIPNWMGPDKRYEMGEGFLQRIEKFHALGCRIVKFWAAPRSIDIGKQIGDPNFMRLDSPVRLEQMQLAHDLGMYFMTHVGDPDTWFATKYADASVYGTKSQQYEVLEELLDRFTQPWIAAHMGGWPEDLDFLARMLQRHSNLYLDTSAAKWMIRELSKHPRAALLDFLSAFRGRILFGSDIVTVEEHLVPAQNKLEIAAKAHTPQEAFDLYASRYWALRTLLETKYEGESPISDPDLNMVDAARFAPTDAPQLTGKSLPAEIVRDVYHEAAAALLEPLHQEAATKQP